MNNKASLLASILGAVLLLCGCSNNNTESISVPQYATKPFATEASYVDDFVMYAEENTESIVEPFDGFGGISISKPSPVLGNSQQNIKYPLYSGLVCRDEKRDCTYVSAEGYDYKLYKCSGGSYELIFDKTVWGMNVVGDSLYCIMNTEKPIYPFVSGNVRTGDIYRIDLYTMEEELILDVDALSLAVTDDELYYISGIDFDARCVCSYNISTGVTKSINSNTLGFYGEYILFGSTVKDIPDSLYNVRTEETVRFTDNNAIYTASVVDDDLYFSSQRGALYRINMTTGEVIDINPKNIGTITVYKDAEYEETINAPIPVGGYVVVDGYTYLVFDYFAVKIAYDGTYEVFYTGVTASSSYYYDALFYDGEIIYALKCNYGRNYYKLVEVSFPNDPVQRGEISIKMMTEKELM